MISNDKFNQFSFLTLMGNAKFFHWLCLSFLIGLSSGCSNTVELSKALPNDPDFAPIMPEEQTERIVPTGSLFKPHYVNNIYSDSKAHRVGDIISVILSEKTQAKKKC
jgi:flagellar L-ring protein precursor FlgH